eukprot:s408_g20.t1
MSIGEKLFGEYVWGVYDLLVLPPSFPYGGMENPCLTFVTPTLLAGDKSLADVVAHEITHSWFGNLCTNRSWECFWLNEGFTKFGECRIMQNMNGKDYEQLLLRNLCIKLKEDISHFGNGHEFTKLCPRLPGVDPDDAFSGIPYVSLKGQMMLLHLESLDFKNFFLEHFSGEPAVKDVDWNTWFYGCGLPPMPEVDSRMAKEVDLLCASLLGGYDGAAEDIKGWFPAQTELLLDRLIDHARGQTSKEQLEEVKNRLDPWNEAFKFDQTKNSELRFRWLMLALDALRQFGAARTESLELSLAPRVDAAIAMAKEVGRMKFTRPLYRELAKKAGRRAKAKEAFAEAKATYHPITAKMVAQDLAKADAQS